MQGIFLDINSPKGKKPAREVLDVAKKYKANIKQTVWRGNFVRARNENFARVTKDYDFIMWLDSDDELIHGEKIAAVLAVMERETSGLYIDYKYDHDEFGNVTVSHWVARIVRNNDTFAWKSSFADGEQTVHETLVEVRAVSNVKNDEFWVKHNATNERRDASLIRNIGLLEAMYKANTTNPDPRILFYLATHYMDARMWMRAKPIFEQYLTMSGWAEERSQALVHLGDIYKAMEQPDNARGCYMKAVAENPSDPSPYVELGQLEVDTHNWEKAIEWLTMATEKQPKHTAIVQRPLEATYRAYKLLAEAYTNMDAKGLENALKWLRKAIALRPIESELLQAKEMLEEMKRTKTLNEAAVTIIGSLREKRELDKIIPFVDNLPREMQESPLAVKTRAYYAEPQIWPEKSIAIFCGPSALGEWGPWSLKEGIGGSEEAVVHLGNQLRDLGWSVTVYNTPGSRAGNIDGVHYEHYWKFNPRDTFDVLIGWRSPSMFDKAFKARKRYLWLHDVVDRPELTPERIANLEKVIFVSQYHRDLYKIPEAKAFVSGNGIAPEEFEVFDGIERDRWKVVYMSAHERGQQLLMQIWPDVVKALPKAHLHCYYGWAGFDHINRANPERLAWKEQMIKQGEQLPNYTDHGKVGHETIIKEAMSAGVWAYPTSFPEVYCITAVKAQAAGAWPVISNYAALKENVIDGDKVEIGFIKGTDVGEWSKKQVDDYTKLLINRLKNPATDEQRKQIMGWARNNKSWQATAEQWSAEFGV